MTRIFIAMIAVFLLLGAFAGEILDGIKTWRTEDVTQYEIVTTGVGQTTANVTLDSDLFQDDEDNVSSISSNISESPVATSYTAASNKLLVSALNANDTRTLTIDYYADTESDVMLALGPFLGFLVIGGLLFAIAMVAFKRR